MTSSATIMERASHRTVILLRASEKQKLERIATRENLTTAEVIRRLIQDGDASLGRRSEEQTMEAVLSLLSKAVREANESMERTIAKVDQLHAELMERDVL